MSSSIARLFAEPLPECAGCGRPTKRKTHQENGGLCSSCHIASPTALFDAELRSRGLPTDAR